MILRKGMKGYLAGAICHDIDCDVWRKRIEAELPEFEWFNPLTYHDYSKWSVDRRLRADSGDKVALQEIKNVAMDIVIPGDLQGLATCDFLVCLVKRDVRIYGAVCEVFQMKYHLNRPVLLISELSYSEMNGWEIGLSDEIFHSLDEFVEFMSYVP